MKHSAIILAFTFMVAIACSNEAVETNQNTKEKRAGDSATITIDLYVKKACGATEPTIALVEESSRSNGYAERIEHHNVEKSPSSN